MHSKYSAPSTTAGALLLAAALHALPACSPAALAPAPASVAPCAGLDVDQCAAKYSDALITCNRTASSLEESDACEEATRKAYVRPSLTGSSPSSSSDAGKADASADGGAP